MQRILLVDDDRLQVDIVSFLLRRAGFDTTAAYDAATGRHLFDQHAFDLVVLDVHLGEGDGRELLKEFRSQRSDVSILMLTMLAAEDDRVHGLELGADDYLSKPFHHRELVARVRALLRRRVSASDRQSRGRMHVGSVELDPMTFQVTRAGRRVALTPTEFRLLQTLMERPNTVVSTRTLLKDVWGHEDLTARNVVRVTASRLRSKLYRGDARPALQTVPGQGLMLTGELPAFQDTSAQTPASGPGEAPRDIAVLDPGDTPVDQDVIDDLQELLQDGAGGPTLRQLNEAYAQTVATHVAGMRAALASGDASGLREQAHRLRGASATIGARRVMKLCAACEARSRTGELETLDAVLQALEHEAALFQASIAPILGTT